MWATLSSENEEFAAGPRTRLTQMPLLRTKIHKAEQIVTLRV
jgi:hypothetical protein